MNAVLQRVSRAQAGPMMKVALIIEFWISCCNSESELCCAQMVGQIYGDTHGSQFMRSKSADDDHAECALTEFKDV